jgi:hypothetical protein
MVQMKTQETRFGAIRRIITFSLIVAVLTGSISVADAAPLGDPPKGKGKGKVGSSRSGNERAARSGRSGRSRAGNSRSRRNGTSHSRRRSGTTRTRGSSHASTSRSSGNARASTSRSANRNEGQRNLSGRQKFGDMRTIQEVNRMFDRNHGKANSNGSRIATITFREKGILSKPGQTKTIKVAKMIGSYKPRN